MNAVRSVASDVRLFGRYGCAVAEAAAQLGLATAIGQIDRQRSKALFIRWAKKQRERFGITVNKIDNSGDSYDCPPYVFVQLNQTTLAETLIWPLEIPLAYRVVINLEYALLPLVGWSLVAQGCPVVVRQWKAQARRAINRAKALVVQGEALVLSIEGKRSIDGTLSPYKKGPSVLAIETQATIIPFVIRGARALIPYGAFRLSPGHVELEFLPAIKTKGLTLDHRTALTAQLRALAEAHL